VRNQVVRVLNNLPAPPPAQPHRTPPNTQPDARLRGALDRFSVRRPPPVAVKSESLPVRDSDTNTLFGIQQKNSHAATTITTTTTVASLAPPPLARPGKE
jgi:hypothetical protein